MKGQRSRDGWPFCLGLLVVVVVVVVVVARNLTDGAVSDIVAARSADQMASSIRRAFLESMLSSVSQKREVDELVLTILLGCNESLK